MPKANLCTWFDTCKLWNITTRPSKEEGRPQSEAPQARQACGLDGLGHGDAFVFGGMNEPQKAFAKRHLLHGDFASQDDHGRTGSSVGACTVHGCCQSISAAMAELIQHCYGDVGLMRQTVSKLAVYTRCVLALCLLLTCCRPVVHFTCTCCLVDVHLRLTCCSPAVTLP